MRVKVRACGVCRTDLHVTEGELPPRKSPVIPGHQVVGVVDETGEGARRFERGDHVWGRTTPTELANIAAPVAKTSATPPILRDTRVDGGYAEYVVAPESFV